jgi:beta-lactamase class A
MSGSVEAGIQQVLAAVGVTGFVHARCIDQDREVALRADEPVLMASLFKITVCLELFRQADAGEVDLAERHLVAAASRSPGPVGLSFMAHDVGISLGDLAYLMMAVSDNAATDTIMARVGLDRINATLAGLGLERTVVAGDCADIGQAIMDAVGASGPDDLPPLEDPEVRRRLLACRALDPAVATRTTPRELTALLAMIWRGEAGLPASANGVSWLMAQQLCHARMAGAFPFPPWVGAKRRAPVGQPRRPTSPEARSAARSGRSPASPSSTWPPRAPSESSPAPGRRASDPRHRRRPCPSGSPRSGACRSARGGPRRSR